MSPAVQHLKAFVGAVAPWVVVLALLTTAAVLLVLRIRAKTLQKEQAISDLMSKFREQHSKGELTDAEYRTIKTTLAMRFQQQVKEDGNKG
jgi:uncharacterized membrane protein